MDSILNWAGGKSQSAKMLVSLLPEHDCYIETFFGAGWCFFLKEPSKVEVINDINSELINFYRVIQRQNDKFLERGKYEMYSRELYYEYLNDFYSGKHTTLSDLERAFRFFCLIKEAFASKFSGGWGYGSVRNSASAFFNEFNIIDDISKRLKKVQIDNRDFEDIIKGYDNERVVFYCDPPYSMSDNDDYYFKSNDNKFDLQDHQRLYLALKNIKGKFILTYDNGNWVTERYCYGEPILIDDRSKLYYSKESGFYWMENEVFYCSADKDNRRHEIELIIMNYNPNKQKKHIDVRQGKLVFS